MLHAKQLRRVGHRAQVQEIRYPTYKISIRNPEGKGRECFNDRGVKRIIYLKKDIREIREYVLNTSSWGQEKGNNSWPLAF